MNNEVKQDTSILSEWWKQIDKWLLGCLFILIVSGFLISLTINPKLFSSDKIGFLTIFSTQHIYLLIGLFLCLGISMININFLKKIIIPIFILTFLLLLLTILIGQEWNGSKRWISFNYFTIMPIEFKAFFLFNPRTLLRNKY